MLHALPSASYLRYYCRKDLGFTWFLNQILFIFQIQVTTTHTVQVLIRLLFHRVFVCVLPYNIVILIDRVRDCLGGIKRCYLLCGLREIGYVHADRHNLVTARIVRYVTHQKPLALYYTVEI